MADLKETLKRAKLNESVISMIIGVIVIIVVGVLAVQYFTDDTTDNILPPATTEDSLSGTHIVEEGESLWTIAEEEYGSGYLWTEIAEVNSLASPGDIEVGQTLTLPEVQDDLAVADPATETEAPVPTDEPEEARETVEPTTRPTEEPLAMENGEVEGLAKTSSHETYTVKSGDNLWEIATEVYNDGYRWSDIAEANELVNPDTIHSGNVLVLPE